MRTAYPMRPCGDVALLAEGVDRNAVDWYDHDYDLGRPPRGGRGSKLRGRGAGRRGVPVALLAEGVDRNLL